MSLNVMSLIATLAVLVVAALHAYFLVLEMFLWTKPTGLRTFGMTSERAALTASLAANQGLYNGFLATGLLWGVLLGPAGYLVKVFFLLCVIVAGVFGAATAKRSILYIQALPAVVALLLVWLAR
jgi:putative membrane protein